MAELLGATESLCPICLRRIPATRVNEKGNIYLEKSCPEHGACRVLLWRGAGSYLEWDDFGRDLGSPKQRLTEITQGCPFDCGLCPQHKAETCVAIIEVTSRCNLACPVCFASSKANGLHPEIATIQRMFQTVLASRGNCPVQLSGGEPTLRDDLPQILALGRETGFDHIMVNTNGLRIAQDPGYLLRLRDNGARTIYLQFDGVSDDVYLHIRGRKFLASKIQALQNCSQAELGVILVPTLIPGVNDHQIGDIVQLAKKWAPVVKGIHFQPVSFFGRYPEAPCDEDRITIPDVIQALEAQTKGELKRDNFVPRRRRESHCAFSGLFVVMDNGKLLPLTSFRDAKTTANTSHLASCESPAEKARRFLDKRWTFTEPEEAQCPKPRPGTLQHMIDRARTHSFSISCMPFQDVWNVDLDRLQSCCTHVVTADERIIPLCAYYITSSEGQRLDFSRVQVGQEVANVP